MTSFSRFAKATESVRYDGFGGVTQETLTKNVFQPFTAKTGIAVNQGSFSSEVELLSKITADGLSGYSFYTSSDQSNCLRFIDRGFVEPLDENKIPRLRDVIKRPLDEYRKLTKTGAIAAVPYYLSGVMIAYNREKIDKAELESKGANILLDPKYKDHLGGENMWLRRIWYAALQSGQDPNNIKDMNAIWEKIRESKKVVFKYWNTGADHIQLFSSGEIFLSDGWFSPIRILRRQGHPIDGWPAKGISVGFGSFVALKGAPMDAFYEMVDILLRPEVQIAQSIATGNVTMLDPTKVQLPDEVRALIGFDPEGRLEGYSVPDPFYWTSNADAWQREYQRVIARG